MPKVDLDRGRILRRLERNGWVLARHGKAHDVYRHPQRCGKAVVPRHRTLSPEVARQIAKIAGWI